MYRRNVTAALTAALVLGGLAACGDASVVQDADTPSSVVHAGATAEPGEPGEPGSGGEPGRHGHGIGEAGEDGEPGRIENSAPRPNSMYGDAAWLKRACDPRASEPVDARSDDPYEAGDVEPEPPARTILTAGFALWPKIVTARPGEAWRLGNCDIARHRLRSVGTPASIDSGFLGSDGTADSPWQSTLTMPTRPGTYRVECVLHPDVDMNLTIEVR